MHSQSHMEMSRIGICTISFDSQWLGMSQEVKLKADCSPEANLKYNSTVTNMVTVTTTNRQVNKPMWLDGILRNKGLGLTRSGIDMSTELNSPEWDGQLEGVRKVVVRM